MNLKFGMKWRLAFIYVLFCTMPLMAFAEKYALLVGVARYPSLPESRQLKGTTNDVQLMRDVLLEKGFSPTNIQQLTDGITNAQSPTRAAILASLKELSLKTKQGDLVYLHFSLHGSQQPEFSSKSHPREIDGLDEIILPSDIGKWDSKLGTVTNAIIDNELHIFFQAIRRNGAFVFAVFDTCHAATMSRGVNAHGEVTRYVSPEELGIPSRLTRHKRHFQRGAKIKKTESEHSSNMGGYVGFYAAESDQLTPEIVISGKKKQGLFTFHLAQSLRATEAIDYQTLGQSVLYRYAKDQRHFPTPIFEGNQLHAKVFELDGTPSQPKWRAFLENTGPSPSFTMHVGKLHQFDQGSIFALFANPTDGEKNPISYAKVDRVDTFSSTLIPIAFRDKPVPEDAALRSVTYARLIQPQFDPRLRIWIPPNYPKNLNRAMKLLESKLDMKEIDWKSKESTADVRLVSDRHFLCFNSPTQRPVCNDQAPRIQFASNYQVLADWLSEAAHKLARSRMLVELASAGSQIQTHLSKVKLQLQLQRASEFNSEPFSNTITPKLKTGDHILLNIKNHHHRSVDLTCFIVDSAYGITTIYPQETGETNRLEPGANVDIHLTITDTTKGLESLVVMLREAEPHELVQDYSFLSQDKLPLHFASTTKFRRGRTWADTGASNSASSWTELFDFAQNRHTRGKSTPTKYEKNQMRLIQWVTQ